MQHSNYTISTLFRTHQGIVSCAMKLNNCCNKINVLFCCSIYFILYHFIADVHTCAINAAFCFVAECVLFHCALKHDIITLTSTNWCLTSNHFDGFYSEHMLANCSVIFGGVQVSVSPLPIASAVPLSANHQFLINMDNINSLLWISMFDLLFLLIR